MQNIVFYAAAKETLGMVRDYSNMHLSEAPVLTIGVAVCLRMRLFADVEVPTPYPIASLNGIAKWHWSMDADFDRSTSCKLVADEGGISVQTVTDTVNGESMIFTEFVIPISDMNTEELAAWLGNEATKPGLTGELVGYDNEDHAVFVLQIEDFKVRNRVAGLGAPNAVDEGFLTRSYAEQIIQSTVSSSAAEKQDKLTPANGGVGISVTSSGIISTADVPQSAVTGLAAALDAKQNNLAAGYRMELVSGSTVDQARYFAIEPAITASANQTTTVVLSAGKAYEIHAVANNAKVLLNRENPVGGSRIFGLEGHAEIFVANTGYIQTGENVVLSQPLEPDAVNNCTVRFHDNLAIISVEDHIAGYIVNVSSGTTAGSLYYGLADAAVTSQEYISVNDSLAGVPLNLGGATVSTTKHLVGNGYADTLVTGDVAIASGFFTVANCALQNVNVTSGTLTLGDAYIPSGSTVAVSGGGLAVEKVTGNGGVIDLGGGQLFWDVGSSGSISAVSILNGTYNGTLARAGFHVNNAVVTISGSTVNNLVNPSVGVIGSSAYLSATSCTFATEQNNNGFWMYNNASAFLNACKLVGTSNMDNCDRGAKLTLMDCEVDTIGIASGGTVELTGTNTVGFLAYNSILGLGGTVTLASGAILNLTGNTNATPIAPGGGITFEHGGATVVCNSGGQGAVSSCTISGAVLSNLGNACNTTSSYVLKNYASATFNGFTFDSQVSIYDSLTHATFSGCTFSGVFVNGVTGRVGGSASFNGNNTLTKPITDSNPTKSSFVELANNASFTATSGLCTTIGTIVVNSGVIVNGNTVTPGTYTSCSIDSAGNITVDGVGYISGNARLLATIVGNGSVTLTSGAILDLTGNENETPIAPGGGITFASGGATVKVGDSTASSSYMMDNVKLPAGAKLTNTAVVNLVAGNKIVVPQNTTASASGVTFTSGFATPGGAFYTENGTINLTNCTITGCSATTGTVTGYYSNTVINLTSCTFSGNDGYVPGPFVTQSAVMNLSKCTITGDTFRTAYCTAGGKMNFIACTLNATCVLFGGSATFAGENTVKQVANEPGSSGTVIISSGAVINLTSSIEPGGAITIPASAVVRIIGSNGVSSGYFSDLAVTGATITNLGRIYGATVTVPPLEDGGDRGPWELETTEGTSTVSAISGESQQIVMEGGLISIIGQ